MQHTRSRPRAGFTALACTLAAACLVAVLGPWAGARAASAPAPTASASAVGTGHAAAATIPLFAYYYIWYTHSSWTRAKKDLPLIGPYSSSDPWVMRHQIDQAKAAGITGFIVSWKDTPLDDQRLQTLIRVAAQEHFKLAMIYEGLDFARKPLPVSEVAADFATFRDKFASSQVFYRINGRPLTIWSGTWAFSYAQVTQVTTAVRPQLLVLSTEKSVAGFQRIAAVTDGDAYYWSSVNPETNTNYQPKLQQMSQAVHHDGKYWIAPFAPGFDARLVGGQKAVPRNNGQTLRTEYATAVSSSPNMLGLISWNEFSENSYVEPSKDLGYQSLNVLKQLRTPLGTPVSGPTPVTRISPWPNTLRLLAFAVALVLGVGSLAFLRRRQSRRRHGHPTTPH